ncbi:MAG: hypothetical protein WAO19_13050 [Candidatus Kryptoniota bacterium]
MTPEQTKELLAKRTETEQKLAGLLKKRKRPFTVADIKHAINNEKGTNVIALIIRMFDMGPESASFEELMKLIMDAWNYFPHKSLNGLSPREKYLG